MNKFENNPFHKSALKDFRLLAGRDKEYKVINFILKNASKQNSRFQHLIISGNRGVGKTSFLNLIENDARAQFGFAFGGAELRARSRSSRTGKKLRMRLALANLPNSPLSCSIRRL